MCDRIIVLIDMDCFYCQVETRYDPSLIGKPMAVVQYNQWQGGGIIAVNYEARAFGVTRHIRGNEAKKKCPGIILVHVPSVRGKADLTRYRNAGREVVDVLCRFCDTVQRASVDEAYLDITHAVDVRYNELKGTSLKPDQLKNTFIVGFSPGDSNDEAEREKGLSSWLNTVYQSELIDERAEKLAVAALLVEEMRAAVYESTGFHCSAGIAHNKILAKLACGLHKPQRQTILPLSGVPILYRNLPLKKIRGLGGKFGNIVMERLNVTFMGELQQFSLTHLQKTFDEKSGSWLYNIAQGLDDEVVTSRLTSKSIGCCKKFPGKLALNTKEMVNHWLSELAEEIAERLENELLERNRKATQFVVSYMQTIDGFDVSASRCGPLNSFEPKQIVQDAMELLKRSNTLSGESSSWYPPLKFLGLSVGKFSEEDSKNTKIENFFRTASKRNESNPSVDDQTSCNLNTKIGNILERNSQLTSRPEVVSTKEEKKSMSLEDSKNTIIESFVGSASKKDKSNPHVEDETSGNLNKFENISEQNNPLPSTPEVVSKEEKKSMSSGKKSFFLKFFKQEGLISTPSSSKFNDENETGEENKSKSVQGAKGNSQQASTSEGYKGVNNRPLHLLQVHESSNDSENPVEHWVSPGELFPNLDEVDDDVAALLPSPLQQQLRTRILKHQESKNPGKNKGFPKGKCKKSLIYDHNLPKTEDELEDDPLTISPAVLLRVGDQEGGKISDEEKVNEVIPRNISQEDIFASYPSVEIQNVTDKNNVKSHVGTKFKKMNVSWAVNNPEEKINKTGLSDGLVEEDHNHIEEIAPEVHGSIVLNNDEQLKEVAEILKELCPHCKQLISLQEYPEHLDFHVAADLDKEINRTTMHRLTEPRKDVSPIKSPRKDALGKRKRGKLGQKQVPPASDKKMRSITAFFAPIK